MSELKGSVRLLTSSDIDRVNEFRLEYLAKGGGFSANPEAIVWSEDDEKAKVLGIFSDQGEILASMRCEIMPDPDSLVSKLDFEYLGSEISFPCGLIGKAATKPITQGMGLNTYLRYLAYQEFYRQNIGMVVGTIMVGAPRTKLLHDLGYHFVENPKGWRRFGYQSGGPTEVVWLDLNQHRIRIESVLSPLVRENMKRFPYAES